MPVGGVTHYPDLAVASFSTPTILYNTAVGAEKCSVILSQVSNVNGLHKSTGKLQAVSLLCGANDALNSVAEATSYANILSWVSSVKAAGYTNVAIGTMISLTGQAAFKNTLNADIRNGAAGNGYTVMDFGANANIGCDNCFSSSTYFIDGIHPTQAGANIMGTIAEAVLNGFGFN